MNTYEILVLFKPLVDVENTDNILKSVEKNIQTFKGKVIKADKIGRKRLAYEIAKYKDAFFVNFVVQMPPESIKEFNIFCRHNEDILRHSVLHRLEIPETRPEMAPMAAGAGGPGGPGGRPPFRRRPGGGGRFGGGESAR